MQILLEIYTHGINYCMGEDYSVIIRNRVNELFHDCIEPVMQELVSEYNSIKDMETKIVSESPVMMGIEKYLSILFRYPNGVEHLICVYWIIGEEKIVVENLRMVTLNRSLSIYNLSSDELKKTIKLLAGLGRS